MILKKAMLTIVVVFFSAALCFCLVGCSSSGGKNASASVGTEGFSVSTSKKGDDVVVSTSYGDLAYPYSFSDVIMVNPEETEEGAYAMEFAVSIDDIDIPLYTVWFGIERGQEVGSVEGPDGDKTDVYVELFDAPEDMIGADLDVFCAAQETVNDVLESLLVE